MTAKRLICINCPLGCTLTAQISENGDVLKVEGNHCKRGLSYAKKELTAPMRVVTSTVKVRGSSLGAVVVSCKTQQEIPKCKIFKVMNELKNVVVTAPVGVGDVLYANVAETGVDVVATCEVL